MPAKQGIGHNKITAKRLCVLGILAAVCLIFGYIESLFPLFFIAPGVKVGLSNAVALILVFYGDKSGAVLVNGVRIFLSALLFGSVTSFVFSFFAGMISLFAVIFLSRLKSLSAVGTSIAGGILHNAVQCGIAMIITGAGVICYLPILIIFGILAGGVTGMVGQIILKKLKTNGQK